MKKFFQYCFPILLATATAHAAFNTTNWLGLGSGTDAYANAVIASGSNIYVGGTFSNASGNLVKFITKWDGTNWLPLGSG